MLHTLIDFDLQLLVFCNSLHTPVFDSFFWTMSAQWFTIVVLLPLFGIMIYRKYGIEALLLIMAMAVTVLLSDRLASGFFKPVVHRLRPSHDPTLIVHLVNDYRGGLYGFVSSHAANTFGVATLLILLFRNKLFTCAILLFASLVSYSRIYMGVHFPGDVICGAAMGALLGWGVFALYNLLRCRLFKIGKLDNIQNPYRIDAYARNYALFVFAAILLAALGALFMKV